MTGYPRPIPPSGQVAETSPEPPRREAVDDQLPVLPAWETAHVVKANPDKAQRAIRESVLTEGKVLYLGVPLLADKLPSTYRSDTEGDHRGTPARPEWRDQNQEVRCCGKERPSGGGRVGAVRGRSQFKGPNGNWTKRDTKTGRIMDQKQDGTPFKGVTKEK